MTAKLWTCPECAFSFDAMHENEGGGYSCPLCENERLRAALIMIADKDKGPLYSVNAEAGTSKQVGWAYGTAGQLAKRALGE